MGELWNTVHVCGEVLSQCEEKDASSNQGCWNPRPPCRRMKYWEGSRQIIRQCTHSSMSFNMTHRTVVVPMTECLPQHVQTIQKCSRAAVAKCNGSHRGGLCLDTNPTHWVGNNAWRKFRVQKCCTMRLKISVSTFRCCSWNSRAKSFDVLRKKLQSLHGWGIKKFIWTCRHSLSTSSQISGYTIFLFGQTFYQFSYPPTETTSFSQLLFQEVCWCLNVKWRS